MQHVVIFNVTSGGTFHDKHFFLLRENSCSKFSLDLIWIKAFIDFRKKIFSRRTTLIPIADIRFHKILYYYK
jgi:hypothetical protein